MGEELRFDFEGRTIRARPGQTLGGALHAAGIRTLSWSAKFRRARGLRCGTGACPGCTVAVDGVGGVQACVTPVRAGVRVRRIRPRWLLLPADTLGFLVPAGFQDSRWLRGSRRWNRVARLIAHLAGQGLVPRPADAAHLAVTSLERRTVDVLVVGGGRRGMDAALAAGSTPGTRVLLVERGTRLGGRLLDDPATAGAASSQAAELAAAGVEVLLDATALGAFAEGVEGVSAGPVLWAINARTVIRETGSLDRELVLPDGDRPGVLLPSAVARLIVREGVRPGRRAVIVYTPDGDAQARATAVLLRGAGVELAATCGPAEVLGIAGRTRVEGVRFARGLVRCDLVVLCNGRRPADELARQANLPVEPHVAP